MFVLMEKNPSYIFWIATSWIVPQLWSRPPLRKGACLWRFQSSLVLLLPGRLASSPLRETKTSTTWEELAVSQRWKMRVNMLSMCTWEGSARRAESGIKTVEGKLTRSWCLRGKHACLSPARPAGSSSMHSSIFWGGHHSINCHNSLFHHFFVHSWKISLRHSWTASLQVFIHVTVTAQEKDSSISSI